LPTDSSPNRLPPQRPHRWLRILSAIILPALLALAAALYFATRHLPLLAKWALERAFPGASVEIRKLDIVLPNRLTIESLVLKSRKDGATLLTLGGGSLSFSFDDLRRRQIGEVRLVEPVINASPRLPEAFLAPQNSKSSGTWDIPWSVRRLVCDYGELNVAEFGPPGLSIRAKFFFDLKDFSAATAPALEHEVVIWDITAATAPNPQFLSLDLVRARFDLEGLIKNRTLKSLTLDGGSLILGKSLREIFAAPAGTAQTTLGGQVSSASPAAIADEPAGKAWIVGTLDIHRVAIRLEDERPEVSDITFALNTSLKTIPLSKSASNLGSEPQLVEIANLDIASPLDPLTKVLTLDSLFLRFTLAGLLRGEIDSLTILGPTIYVGEDLFWYMDDMQKRLGLGKTGEEDSGPAWKVKELIIDYGRLTLGSGGRRQYGLPLGFRTRAQDIALDNLAALKLQAVLEIPPQRYVFDSYQLEFTSEQGELRFAYPPEKNVNNLVGTIQLKAIRWRQYKASDSWVSVTFDQNGINGTFGGNVYRGDVSGGFSFFFQSDSPWIGWVSGSKVALGQLTNVISPQNFQMSGPLEFRLQMDAEGHRVDRVLGEFHVTKPGRMVIGKIDELLERIPPTWNLTKQSSTRIALETLRDFHYTKAGGDFWFVQSQGVLRLALQGPNGSRNFDVVLHADDSPQGRWKKGSANR
jgi:hypothetical protein